MQITNPAENFDVSALKLDAPTIDYSNIYEAHVTAAIDRMSSSLPLVASFCVKRLWRNHFGHFSNVSLLMKNVLKKLKENVICSVHKDVSSADSKTYILLSLTSQIRKFME